MQFVDSAPTWESDWVEKEAAQGAYNDLTYDVCRILVGEYSAYNISLDEPDADGRPVCAKIRTVKS